MLSDNKIGLTYLWHIYNKLNTNSYKFLNNTGSYKSYCVYRLLILTTIKACKNTYFSKLHFVFQKARETTDYVLFLFFRHRHDLIQPSLARYWISLATCVIYILFFNVTFFGIRNNVILPWFKGGLAIWNLSLVFWQRFCCVFIDFEFVVA